MPKECAVCKQPAVVAAKITQGEETANAYLCENCTRRLGKKLRVEIVASAIAEMPKGYVIDPNKQIDEHENKQSSNMNNDISHVQLMETATHLLANMKLDIVRRKINQVLAEIKKPDIRRNDKETYRYLMRQFQELKKAECELAKKCGDQVITR